MEERRRRSAGKYLAITALVLGPALATGCGGGADEGAAEPERNTVRFTREDGSLARFPAQIRAWCAPFDDDNGDVPAVHIVAGKLPSKESEADPFWMVRAVRADIEGDRETALPNNFVYTEPRGASLFALDDTEHQRNELSSASERSAGKIGVQLAGCNPGDDVEVTFDEVTLGSEFGDGPSIAVEGVVSTRVGNPP